MNRLQIRSVIKGILDDTVGTDTEQYWGKETLNTFIQEAMDEIAKRTLCIKDSITPAFCSIPLVADQIHYKIPAGVLNIDSVRASWTGKELSKTDHNCLLSSLPLWESSTQEPFKYLTDFTTGYLSLVGRLPVVSTETLNLTVRRLPAVMTDDANIPDVPEQFHNMAYDYVLYRCFIKQDSEVFSKSSAQDYLSRFEGPQSQLGKGGNIQQIILQIRPESTKSKVRFF